MRPYITCRSIGAWKVNGYGCALANRTFDSDLAAGLVGEPEDLTEAKPGALADRLGREKWLECAFLDLWGHAAAGVSNLKDQIFPRTNVADLVGLHNPVAGADRQRARGLHRVARISRTGDC